MSYRLSRTQSLAVINDPIGSVGLFVELNNEVKV